MDRLVRLTPVDPPGRELRFHLLGQASLSGGVGGWEVVPRPARRGLTEWAGVDPWRLEMTLMTDGLDVRPGVNASVEPKLAALTRAASKVPGGVRPPLLAVSGPVPKVPDGLRWVIEDLAPGEEVRRSDGQRVQAQVTVRLLEHVPADLVVSPARQARQRQPPGTTSDRSYTVAAGDTLSSIAARMLGAATRWPELAALNGVRDPRALRVGQTLKLP